MAMTAEEIVSLIKQALPTSKIELKDLAGDGEHYAIKVISSEFAGKAKVTQHQMVYAALGGRMGEQLHALSITTATEESH